MDATVTVLWRYFLCFMFFVLLFEQGYTSGGEIKCFACESKADGPCSDTFESTGVQVMRCNGSCVKSKNKYKKLETYSRYCASGSQTDPEGCQLKTYETGPHIECHCYSDYCNTGTLFQSHCGVLFIVVFVCFGVMSLVTS